MILPNCLNLHPSEKQQRVVQVQIVDERCVENRSDKRLDSAQIA